MIFESDLAEMSSGTAPSSSTGSGNNSHSSNEIIDHSAYTYDLPQDVLNSVSYYLDQNNAWEEAARRMGYTPNDIIVSCNYWLLTNV